MRRMLLLAAAAALAACSSSASLAPLPIAGPPVQTHLTFTGAFTATVTGSVAVQPPLNAKGDGSDAGTPRWTTQCTFAGGKTATWSAQVSFATPGNVWMMTIGNGNSFGNPAAIAYEASTARSKTNTGLLELDVRSQHPIADEPQTSLGDEQGYDYYIPVDHKDGKADVTIDPGLRSGKIDTWLVPDSLGSPHVFHLAGAWSCA